MVILLVIMGALFSLIFGTNSISRTARGREKVNFFETLIAFLALVFPVLALVANNNVAQPLRLVNMAAIALGAVFIIISAITFLIERRKPVRPLAQRRSVLGVGIGALLVAATIVVPVASKLPSAAKNRAVAASAPVSASNINVAEVASPNAVVSSPIVVGLVDITATQTPDVALFQLSATPTRLASPMPTPTNTPFIIATVGQGSTTDPVQPTGTVQGAADQITGCTVVPRQNVNLRSGPGTTYELLVTIPFSTTLNASAKNRTGDWWFVNYENQSGWVSGDYVNTNSGCGRLPEKAE